MSKRKESQKLAAAQRRLRDTHLQKDARPVVTMALMNQGYDRPLFSSPQGKEQNFVFGIITYVSFALLVSFDAGKATSCTNGCSDGLGLNYTLPMFNECKKKQHPNGSMVQTIPKLIPYSSSEDSCPRQTQRKSKLGIPPGHRVCRFPDCGRNPCENGWCEETMKGYKCHCPTGFQGKHCAKQSTTTTHATKKSTSKSTASGISPNSTPNPPACTESTAATDATTMSTISSVSPRSISNPTAASGSTTPTDATTMSTSKFSTSGISPESTPNPTATTDAATLLLASTIRTVPGSGCQTPWIGFGANCYRFFSNRLKWAEAEEYCQNFSAPSLGGSEDSVAHLVSIHSETEQTFVYNYFVNSTRNNPTPEMWLGLNDRAIEGTFEWIDGTPNDFNAWGGNNPDDSGPTGEEDCTHMTMTAGLNWNDLDCSTLLYLVCKMPWSH